MSVIGQARTWLRSVVLRRRIEREMHEEMAAHIEQAAQRYEARGMNTREAQEAARREFGNVAVIQEQSRDSRGARWIEQTASDLRYAVRYFARTPLTTLTIVLTLTLGVGVNSAAYSLWQGVNSRPPRGVPDDSRLVAIRGKQSSVVNGSVSTSQRPLSARELTAYHNNDAFSDAAGWIAREVTLDSASESGSIQTALATFVTPNFFTTVGVPLAAGAGFIDRRFSTSGTAAEMSAVISNAFANRTYGSPQNAIGKRFKVNEQLLTVVGVTSPEFSGVPSRNYDTMLWIPVSAFRLIEPREASYATSDSGYFYAAARLAEGFAPQRATVVVDRIARQFNSRYATWDDYKNDGADVVRMRGQYGTLSRSQQAENLYGTLALGALDLVILLVCTTTVSSLLVGAAVSRRHEIGVRLALGASRARIVRQLMTESVLLALIGGAGGLAVFVVVSRTFAERYLDLDLSPSWSTIAFTSAIAMLTACMFGVSPALHATRAGLSSTLKESGSNVTSRSRLQRLFVTAQIALAQPLLVCLGMFSILILNEFSRNQTDRELEDQLIVANFNTWVSRENADGANSLGQIKSRLAALPEVVGVAFNSQGTRTTPIELTSDAHPSEIARAQGVEIQSRSVAADYFEMMGVSVVTGKIPADLNVPVQIRRSGLVTVMSPPRSERRPITVSTSFARAVFAEQNPLGRTFCINRCRSEATTYEIVAIVADHSGSDREAPDHAALQVYPPMLNAAMSSSLLIRTRGDAAPFIPRLARFTRAVAPRIPIVSISTVGETNRAGRQKTQTIAGAATGGGVITLLLGCVGLYAVVALAVGQRRREVGIRIAMGAMPAQVVMLFFKSGLRLSLTGMAIGLPLSAVLLRVLGTQAGFPATNTPVLIASIGVIVTAVAAIATWLPARRAAGVDPLVALRAE